MGSAASAAKGVNTALKLASAREIQNTVEALSEQSLKKLDYVLATQEAEEGTAQTSGAQHAQPPTPAKRSMLDDVRDLVSSDAVRFVKLTWLHQARSSSQPIVRRQDLPPDAFWPAADVLRHLSRGDWHPGRVGYVIISYSWLSEAHPDPDKYHLRTFLGWCRCQSMKEAFVFWDFLSLHQRERSHAESALFRHALGAMHCLYGMKCPGGGLVCRLVDVPVDAANATPYDSRGWTTFESQVAMAGGPYVHTVQRKPGFNEEVFLRECKIGEDFMRLEWDYFEQPDRKHFQCAFRDPLPMHPDEFDAIVQHKSFTSPKADRQMVASLYRTVFMEHLRWVETLRRHCWGEREFTAFPDMLPHFPNLRKLILCRAYDDPDEPSLFDPKTFLSRPVAGARLKLESRCVEHGVSVVWDDF